MQFWKDAVESCYQGQPKAEPVSILLHRVLSRGTRLSKSFFQSIISERVCTLFLSIENVSSSIPCLLLQFLISMLWKRIFRRL